MKNIFIIAANFFKQIFEEFRIILRNHSYQKNNPELFAIFSIIEHEQSAMVFDLDRENFDVIRNNILKNKDTSNNHILEALRGLFQNNNLIKNQNLIKDKIANYLFLSTKNMINGNNKYYAPLIKALLHGFPFLLNYDNYVILRKLIRKKTRNSLKIFKDIIDNAQNLDFLRNNNDIQNLIFAAIAFDNKPAFMILVRFMRKNNLTFLLFYKEKFNLKNKVFNIDSIRKKGFDYAQILLSYYENNFLENENDKKYLLNFLENVFVDKKYFIKKIREENCQKINYYLTINKSCGISNSLVLQLILEINQQSFKRKINFSLKKYFSDKMQKPKTAIAPSSFFSLSNRHSEEYWLIKYAPYLL